MRQPRRRHTNPSFGSQLVNFILASLTSTLKRCKLLPLSGVRPLIFTGVSRFYDQTICVPSHSLNVLAAAEL